MDVVCLLNYVLLAYLLVRQQIASPFEVDVKESQT